MNQRARAFFATTAVGLAFAAPAMAQQAVNEVIVTARRVEERLQDVPISITVYNQAQLNDRNVTSTKDLASFTPSLSVNPRYGSEGSSFSLRGFVQDAFTAPSVAIYFGDVVAARGASVLSVGDGAGPGSFYDLQNVQVLKGPQGTLFGRNTTGGAILLVPRKPNSDFGGYVEGSLGDFRMRRLQAALNLPVNDKLYVRFAMDRNEREGYEHNISGIGPSRFNDINYVAGRLSVLWKVTPDLENYTILSATRSTNVGALGQMRGCSPGTFSSGGVLNGKPVLVPVGAMICAQMAREAQTGDYYTVSNSVANPASRMHQRQVINTTTWTANDNLTIKNIASYAELRNVLRQDVYGTNWVIPQGDPAAGAFAGQTISLQIASPPGLSLNDQWTGTEELQFQGRALDGRLTWQAGGYLEISKPLAYWSGSGGPSSILCSDIAALQCASPYAAFGSYAPELRHTTFHDKGAYAQGTYKITDQFRATAGIRYSDDRSFAYDRSTTYRFNQAGAVASTTCTNRGAVLPDCQSAESQHSKAPTWLLDLDYLPAQNMLLYAKYARGYRQGLVNPRGIAPYKSFGPEKVDSYEVGGKMSWNGAMPGLFNVAAFYNDFSNQQILVGWRQGTLTGNAIANTGSSRLYGLEAEVGLSPVEGLKLDANFAYLNTKLTDAALPPAPLPFTDADSLRRTIPGFPFPFAPKYKGAVTATYTLPLPERAGRVSVAVAYNYTDHYAVIEGPGAIVPRFSTTNLNVNWNSVGRTPIDLSLFVTNLFDKHYYNFLAEVPTLGILSTSPAEPRMIGMRVKYRFGADAS
jgi:iron complex outermembrane receptor protein